MSDPVWEKSNLQAQLTALNAKEKAAALEHKTDLEAFRALHQALSRNAPLTVDRLLQVAEKNKIQATRDEIAQIFIRYDANQNSDLELKEFAAWWGTATDGLSVLLRNALSEAILAPGTCEQWKRGNTLRIDATSGTVDDSFEAKSGIYVTVVPSNEASVRELAGAAGSSSAGVPQAVAVAKLSLKNDASDEDIQQLIDLVNVVADEITQADPEKTPFKIQLEKVFEDGKRLIKVSGLMLNFDKDPSKMVSHIATLAGLKDQPLFKRLLFGIEFGVGGEHIFSPLPKGAIAELFDSFRLTAQFEYDDALLKILTVLSLQPDGLNEDSLGKLLATAFIARGARSVHLTSNWRSYKEVAESLVDAVSKVPFSKRAAKDSQELYKQALASALIRARLEAVMGFLNVRATVVQAVPQLQAIQGMEAPEPLVYTVIGLKSSGKSSLIHKFGAQPNGPYFNKAQVYFTKQANKQYVMFIEHDGVVLQDRKVIAVIDASSADTVAQSLRLVSVRMTSNDDLSPSKFIFVVTKSTRGGVAVPFAQVKSTLAAVMELDDEDAENAIFDFDGNTLPAKLKALVDEETEDFDDSTLKQASAGEGEGEGEENEDDEDEDGPSMMAIAKKVFKGVTKCVAGLQEIEVTNSLVSAHIVMDSLPIANALSETNPEAIRRNQMEVQFRLMSIMEFDANLRDVGELAESWEEAEEEGASKPSATHQDILDPIDESS